MISIFAKEAFLNINPNEPFRLRTKPPRGHLQRVSSIIRGDQIANKVGAKFNPTEGYENDVCIYVKPHLKKGQEFKFEGTRSYLDIIDGANLAEVLKLYSEVGCIVCSEADMEIMTRELPNNKIFLIPQHHCNFERLRRNSKGIKKVGIIGEKKAENWFPERLEEELNKRGIELVFFHKFFSREDIVDFYMNIDLQIVWRPYKKILSNPLKIVNASSFGIPTIALDEKAFEEVSGCYMPVVTFAGFLAHLEAIRGSRDLYETLSKKCIEVSERYHIDNISKLYQQL